MATTLIEVCTRKGDTSRALSTYQLMKEAGPSSNMVPSVHAYTAAMRAAAEGGAWDKALDIWSDMEQRACKPTGDLRPIFHFDISAPTTMAEEIHCFYGKDTETCT